MEWTPLQEALTSRLRKEGLYFTSQGRGKKHVRDAAQPPATSSLTEESSFKGLTWTGWQQKGLPHPLTKAHSEEAAESAASGVGTLGSGMGTLCTGAGPPRHLDDLEEGKAPGPAETCLTLVSKRQQTQWAAAWAPWNQGVAPPCHLERPSLPSLARRRFQPLGLAPPQCTHAWGRLSLDLHMEVRPQPLLMRPP